MKTDTADHGYFVRTVERDQKWAWEIRKLPEDRSARRSHRAYASEMEAQRSGDDALQDLLRTLAGHLAKHSRKQTDSQ